MYFVIVILVTVFNWFTSGLDLKGKIISKPPINYKSTFLFQQDNNAYFLRLGVASHLRQHLLSFHRQLNFIYLRYFVYHSGRFMVFVVSQQPPNPLVNQEDVEHDDEEGGVDGPQQVPPVGDLPRDETE